MKNAWSPLDVSRLVQLRNKLRNEAGGAAGATTTANVGAYPVPLGEPLKRVFPSVPDEDEEDERDPLPEYVKMLRDLGF